MPRRHRSTILWRSITVPVGLSLILVLASIGWLRWWRPVYVDDKPVRPWLIAIPVTMLVTILIVTNYSGLATRGIGFTLLLLLSMMFVGFAEEGMFRGIGLTALRRDGFTEGKAALWSTVAFALAHATNLLTEGTGAFAQVLATAVAGYFFYLIRRRTAGLLVPSIVHGLWDFSLISGAVVPGASNLLGGLSFLVMVILAVLLLVKRHDIEPAISPHAGSASKSVT